MSTFYSDSLANYKAEHVTVRSEARDIKRVRAWQGTVVQSMTEFELELIQTQMTQKPMLRAEVGMRVRCANKTSAE